MVITINGKPGSGKSSIARMLSEKLELQYIDIGELRRRAAKKKGMTLEDYNKWGETTFESDKDVDEYQKNLAEDNIVVSGRTSFHFIPQSLKIFLDVDLHEAAKRIFTDAKIHERNETANISSIEDIERSLNERMRSDMARYEKYYGLNVYDESQYDCIIDTTGISLDGVFNKVMEFINSHQKK
jgi:cytidylate kinase